jgi:protein tyrosine phosphatase domain-containing protein 1
VAYDPSNRFTSLQEVGEHAGCGDGILPASGFSYTPERFMSHGIFHYNFSWRDMGCPALDYTLNIVQVVAFTIDAGRKIAVHCHAGLGRTGLVIACYLVFTDRFTPTEVRSALRW